MLFTSFYWVTQSTYLAGEIKNSKRNHFWGMIGAAMAWFVITTVVILVMYATIGPDLIALDHISAISNQGRGRSPSYRSLRSTPTWQLTTSTSRR